MFEQFPKVRPQLPRAIEEIYITQYKSNREGQTTASSLAQRVESWMHKKVAIDVAHEPETKKTTLEIGAGTLNQLQHEPEVGSYDIIEPFKNLYEDSPLLRRARNIYSDISEVPSHTQYNRITSIATFEHILNLPEVIARSELLLAVNGTLRAGIPSEGTLLWALGWRMTTELEFKIKYGLDYEKLVKYEHVNKATEIEEALEFFFDNVECCYFGLSKTVSLYQFYACSNPKSERCRDYAAKEANYKAM